MNLVQIGDIYSEEKINELAILISETETILQVKVANGSLNPKTASTLTKFVEKAKRDIVILKNNLDKSAFYDEYTDSFDRIKSNAAEALHTSMKTIVNLHKDLSNG